MNDTIDQLKILHFIYFEQYQLNIYSILTEDMRMQNLFVFVEIYRCVIENIRFLNTYEFCGSV